MKKLISLALANVLMNVIPPVFAGAQGAISLITPGLYMGVGGGWSLTEEDYHSTFRTNTGNGAIDHYNAAQNRIIPMAQLGYWAPVHSDWLWGLAGQWLYAGYKTTNENSNLGQHIPNASFSSINIFGPDVIRDFSAQTKVTNEARVLLYAGQQLKQGYVYLGIGPAVLAVSNTMYVSSIHSAPNTNSDTLYSNSAKTNKTLWGGAAQVGYNYYINPSYFINFSYTYTQTAKHQFDNSTNTALFNGAMSAGPNLLSMNRRVSIAQQDVAITINKVI
ncbi:hypothetical protein [uncultured Legionella sp.]|uniref:hypothetical protein n=1 Tax=uncultured Legionella sp. TaxID=210934 RepID=UPI002619E112|nr:hypothetical protein [uncultured Legionella sp.]